MPLRCRPGLTLALASPLAACLLTIEPPGASKAKPDSGISGGDGGPGFDADRPQLGRAHLVVAGGVTASGASSEVIDIEVNDDGRLGPVRPAAPLPRSMSSGAAVVVNGAFLVIGGEDASGAYLDVALRSRIVPDAGLDRFEASTTTFPPRERNAAFGMLGRAHLVAGVGYPGITGEARVAEVRVSGEVGEWLTDEPIPSPRSRPAFARVGSFGYVLGGTTPDDDGGIYFSTTVYVRSFEPAAPPGWRATRALPSPTTAGAAVSVRGHVCLIGGYTVGKPAGNVYCALSLPSGELDFWRDLGPLGTPRSELAALAVGPHIYVVGGSDGEGRALDMIESATMAEDGSLSGWAPADARLPSPRINPVAAAYRCSAAMCE